MIRKIATFLSVAAMVTAASGMLYADACGAFTRNNEAAKNLVNKYMASVMRSYCGDEDVSFRGIVKEGCDFWYYNDYNNALICKMSQQEGSAKDTEYSVKFNSVKYSDHSYTVNVTVSQEITYDSSTITSVCSHTFIIEQNGSSLYITDDISDGSDKLLLPDVPQA